MKYILPIGLFLILVSCRKYDLSGHVKSIYDTYNPGDTLVFRSVKSGKICNYVIIGKKIYDHHPYSRELSADISYRNLDSSSNSELFLIYNTLSYYNISFSFNDFKKQYVDSLGTMNRTDTITIADKKIINYYHLYDETKSHKINNIIWQEKYGIVKYDLEDSDSYIRTNIP